MFKAIILDFDGVILESLDVKKKAFLKVYHDYPEYTDEITRYHLENSGISRYKKFQYINRDILKIFINKSKIKEMADFFSEVVVNDMLECPFVGGTLEFLYKYSAITRLFIASGIPQDELRLIMQKRDLVKYFNGIYGTPASKLQIIQKILKKENIENCNLVFIGDAISDYDSAKVANVPFIARINKQIPDNPFHRMDIISVNDLKELDNILQRDF